MSCTVAYSAEARQDLRNIYEYIAGALHVPETAAGQTRRIMKAIRELDKMQLRHKLYNYEPWHSQGVRFFTVDNFLVFYLPNENASAVNVVRIMYGGRGISAVTAPLHVAKQGRWAEQETL